MFLAQHIALAVHGLQLKSYVTSSAISVGPTLQIRSGHCLIALTKSLRPRLLHLDVRSLIVNVDYQDVAGAASPDL